MKKNLFLTFAILLSIALVISFVSAQLGIPHQFYGTVTYNDASAPNGVSVVAKIDGITVKGTTTLDGKYGYDPLFLITDPEEGRAGKTIIFYVNDIESSSFLFSNGRVTELNLAASGPPIGGGGDSGGSGSSGGGGGGGSGGGSGSGGSSSSSTGGTVNTESDTSSDENQNVGGGITGAAVGAGSSKGILTLLIVLVVFLVGALGYFGWKKGRKTIKN